MEHIAALLLIVGCSADLADCRELPAPVPIFETAEECDAELPRAVAGYEGTRPHVVARCVAVDPAMEEADAELGRPAGREPCCEYRVRRRHGCDKFTTHG
jgi:hypothetical protein